MKTIILIIFPFLLSAQTVWYVDGSATGNNTGRNWTDAWTNLDSIWISGNEGVNWRAVSDGDSVYISAGTYYDQSANGHYDSGLPRTGSNQVTYDVQVTVRPAWQLGHTGVVYIKSSAGGRPFTTGSLSNIKFYDIDFVYDIETPSGSGGVVFCEQDSFVVFDNCRILDNGYSNGGTFSISGSAKDSLLNSIIYVSENDLPYDQDPIGISAGQCGHVIDNCLLYVNNHDVEEGGAHRDMVQVSDVGVADGSNLEIVVSNNVIMSLGADMSDANGVFYNDGLGGHQRFLIYNNIVVTRGTESTYGGLSSVILGGHPNGFAQSVRMFHNTFICKGIGTAPAILGFDWADSVYFKNNLVVCDTNTSYITNIGNNIGNGSVVDNVFEWDYNLYAKEGIYGSDWFYVGGYRTFDYWVNTLGYDTNSDTIDVSTVTWVNKYDTLAASYYTNVGIDAGVDLTSEYPFLAYDILGNARDGTPDLGALEYQEATTTKRMRVIIIE